MFAKTTAQIAQEGKSVEVGINTVAVLLMLI